MKKSWITTMMLIVLTLTWGVSTCFATPTFYSTSDADQWLVASSTPGYVGGEGPSVTLSMFPTSGFVTATAETSRTGWIANNTTGNNGPGTGYWTYFVFQQTFNLTGYDPNSVVLSFSWAADDSGAAHATRGRWIPAFSLNGGSLNLYPTWNGSSYTTGDESYSLQYQQISAGFVSGINMIDFYVEGNGITDGFSLQDVEITARGISAVPEPATMLLLGLGLVGLAGVRRKFKQ